jgi:hypothetical protein
MATTPWLTSDDLIDIIKKRIAFPISQNTLSEDDILKFASHEMFDSQVPSIMEYHDEYFVYRQETPLETGVLRYQIPDRAIGMKLRDVFFQTADNVIREMTRITPDSKAYFQQSGTSNSDVYRFYVEGDEIVLANQTVVATGQKLIFTYYLRPNSLVKNARAAICKQFSKTLIIDNTTLVNGNNFVIGSLAITAGTDFAIGANSNITTSNIYVALTALGISSDISGTSLLIKSKSPKTTYTTSNSAALALQSGLGVEFNSIPANITNSSIIDFLQTKGGHRTYSIEVTLGAAAISGNIINFDAGVIPTNFIPGDYICLINECIIPQIPSDLHSLLAERTCERMLMSIGDVQGSQISAQKVAQLEKNQAAMVDNRVEGAPLKLMNRFSHLRLNKRLRRR